MRRKAVVNIIKEGWAECESTKSQTRRMLSVWRSTELTFKTMGHILLDAKSRQSTCAGVTKGRLSLPAAVPWERQACCVHQHRSPFHWRSFITILNAAAHEWSQGRGIARTPTQSSSSHTAPLRRMITWKSGSICFHLGYIISRGLIWTNLPVQPQTLLLVWDL